MMAGIWPWGSEEKCSGEVRVWDTTAGRDASRPARRHEPHSLGGISSAPDGRMLAAASREGVYLWDLAIPSLGRETISIGLTGAPGDGLKADSGHTGTGKKSNRGTATDLFSLVMVIVSSSF